MRMYFISTGSEFPYYYYLGVKSALKVNKEITLFYTQVPGGEYFKKLIEEEKDLTVSKIELDRELPILNFDFYTSTTTKKMQQNWKKVLIFDYLIWKTVSENGGIIMGLDSITTKSWEELLGDKEMFCPKYRTNDYKMHGVIVRKGSQLAKQIFEDVKTVVSGQNIKGKHRAIVDGKYQWGGAGIIAYLNNVLENEDKIATQDISDRTKPLFASSNKNINNYNEKNYPVSNKRKFRFHLLGLVHLPTSEKYMACAFTQKNVKLAKMLLSLGHEVFLYGSEGSDAPCTKFIQTHTLKDIRDAWGEGDNRYEIGYDWHKKQFKHDFNSERKLVTLKYYQNCIKEINKIKRPDDFLLISQGQYQKSIYTKTGLFLNCEFGIGYRGSDKKNFRAFESSYLQNFTYGSENPFKSINGDHYSRVIPNYFDPKDFIFSKKKKDYYLYIGRIIRRKGVWIAIKATEAIGAKLILVGQKDPKIDVTKLPPHCEYQGFADIEKRKKLMSEAIATFVPTLYLEAFAGTHIESMLSGTPPITTNFGVFPETIPDYLNGKIGFKCNTLQDFVDAGRKAKEVNCLFVRKYAERFLMNNVKWEYQKWFEDLSQLYLSSKNLKIKGWHYISS